MTGIIAALFASTSLSTVSTSAKDPYFKNVLLLLHADGTNGGQNNTFIDSSLNNFTITRNGNTTQGSFNPYGALWSNYFDGTGDYLTAPANAAFQFGTGDFTVEAWIYPTAAGVGNQYFITMRNFNGGASGTWGLGQLSDKFVFDEIVAGVPRLAGTSVPVLNAWTHVAVARSGTTIRLFVNGALEATATWSNNFNANYPLYIGYDTGSAYTKGYLSNIRIVKGTAVYTAAFTPPTSPLTAISNTSFLTCQSNRFIDNSTNNFAITRNGDVAVTNFAPFAPTSVYTTGQGASGYLDGNGDVLTAASNAAFQFGTGDFTVEFWVYLYTVGSVSEELFICTRGIGAGFQCTRRNSDWTVDLNSTSVLATASNVLTNGAWAHIAVTRASGTLRLFTNGVLNTTVTGNTTNFAGGDLSIGALNSNNSYNLKGHISDVRLVKGTAVYTAAFTPPTSPLTAITNTQLLCNFKNAAIFDSAAKNDLETVGNAQIDTTTKKFGTGSIKFDGNGDYLKPPDSSLYTIGTGDFTYEFWAYYNALTGLPTVVDNRGPGLSDGIADYVNSSGKYVLYWAGSDRLVSTTSLVASQWTHIAVSRASGTLRIFLNGVQDASMSDSTNFTSQSLIIGSNATNTSYLNGYIDDLRITKGVARYTANFTPPTQAFSDT